MEWQGASINGPCNWIIGVKYHPTYRGYNPQINDLTSRSPSCISLSIIYAYICYTVDKCIWPLTTTHLNLDFVLGDFWRILLVAWYKSPFCTTIWRIFLDLFPTTLGKIKSTDPPFLCSNVFLSPFFFSAPDETRFPFRVEDRHLRLEVVTFGATIGVCSKVSGDQKALVICCISGMNYYPVI